MIILQSIATLRTEDERDAGSEAVRHQDDRGQRAGHEGPADGQGHGRTCSTRSS